MYQKKPVQGAMVSNSALAAVSVSTGLHKHLIIGSPHVAGEIREYETLLLQKRQKEYGVAQQEGRSPGQYWLDLEPPKVGRPLNVTLVRLIIPSS